MSNKELKRCHYIYQKKNKWNEPLSDSEQKFLDEHIDEYLNSDWLQSEIGSNYINKAILNSIKI